MYLKEEVLPKRLRLSGLTAGWLMVLTIAAVGLYFGPVLTPFSADLQPVYAQVSEDAKFWVFDGHMHPTSSVYRRGGTIGEPTADPRFPLPLAKKGGLGGAFVKASVE